MRLIHFSAEPLAGIWPVMQQPQASFKPKGLWVSDEDEYGWREWCRDNDWGDGLAVAHEIEPTDEARLLTITSAAAIDEFTAIYGTSDRLSCWIDWAAVASTYQGILITPYIYERRLSYESPSWYYPWDCASGCIWDTDAIAGFRVVELEPLAD